MGDRLRPNRGRVSQGLVQGCYRAVPQAWQCSGSPLWAGRGGEDWQFGQKSGTPWKFGQQSGTPWPSPPAPPASHTFTPSGQCYRGPAFPSSKPTPSSSSGQCYRGSFDKHRIRVRAANHQATCLAQAGPSVPFSSPQRTPRLAC